MKLPWTVFLYSFSTIEGGGLRGDQHNEVLNKKFPLKSEEKEEISSFVDYVNILGGTNSRYDLSHGNTLPLIATPWSFNTWAPMTTTGSSWWFHPYDASFYGIRCTHQPRSVEIFLFYTSSSSSSCVVLSF